MSSKYISLSKEQQALIDEDCYEWLKQYSWAASQHRDGDYYATAYLEINDNKDSKCRQAMHRLIMGCTPGDGRVVDHKNGNKLDNRRENLRICSRGENASNRHKQANNTSGYKGVHWEATRGKWIASIKRRENGKLKNFFLGRFDCKVEAAKAYNKRALELHGEFAILNKVD